MEQIEIINGNINQFWAVWDKHTRLFFSTTRLAKCKICGEKSRNNYYSFVDAPNKKGVYICSKHISV
jgi:hypothetical protein